MSDDAELSVNGGFSSYHYVAAVDALPAPGSIVEFSLDENNAANAELGIGLRNGSDVVLVREQAEGDAPAPPYLGADSPYLGVGVVTSVVGRTEVTDSETKTTTIYWKVAGLRWVRVGDVIADPNRRIAIEDVEPPWTDRSRLSALEVLPGITEHRMGDHPPIPGALTELRVATPGNIASARAALAGGNLMLIASDDPRIVDKGGVIEFQDPAPTGVLVDIVAMRPSTFVGTDDVSLATLVGDIRVVQVVRLSTGEHVDGSWRFTANFGDSAAIPETPSSPGPRIGRAVPCIVTAEGVERGVSAVRELEWSSAEMASFAAASGSRHLVLVRPDTNHSTTGHLVRIIDSRTDSIRVFGLGEVEIQGLLRADPWLLCGLRSTDAVPTDQRPPSLDDLLRLRLEQTAGVEDRQTPGLRLPAVFVDQLVCSGDSLTLTFEWKSEIDAVKAATTSTGQMVVINALPGAPVRGIRVEVLDVQEKYDNLTARVFACEEVEIQGLVQDHPWMMCEVKAAHRVLSDAELTNSPSDRLRDRLSKVAGHPYGADGTQNLPAIVLPELVEPGESIVKTFRWKSEADALKAGLASTSRRLVLVSSQDGLPSRGAVAEILDLQEDYDKIAARLYIHHSVSVEGLVQDHPWLICRVAVVAPEVNPPATATPEERLRQRLSATTGTINSRSGVSRLPAAVSEQIVNPGESLVLTFRWQTEIEAAKASKGSLGRMVLLEPTADLPARGVVVDVLDIAENIDGVTVRMHARHAVTVDGLIQEQPWMVCEVTEGGEPSPVGEVSPADRLHNRLIKVLGSADTDAESPNLPAIVIDELLAVGKSTVKTFRWSSEIAALKATVAVRGHVLLIDSRSVSPVRGVIADVLDLQESFDAVTARLYARRGVEVGGLLQEQPWLVGSVLHGDDAPTPADEEMSPVSRLRNRIARVTGAAEELETLRHDLTALALPAAARDAIEQAYLRASSFPPSSSDRGNEISFLRTVASLPWGRDERVELELPAVTLALHQRQYGMQFAKDRLLEYIAALGWWEAHADRVSERRPVRNLLLVGAPGTGKTSLAQAFAIATGRPRETISMGGMSDASYLTGTVRSYSGARPGAFVTALASARSRRCVIVLDEVDKISPLREDIGGMLLGVLDPEQNSEFTDQFLGFPIDLSETIFICTANTLRTVHPALVDRCEIIPIEPYDVADKSKMIRSHLLPRQLAVHRLVSDEVTVTEDALDTLVDYYDRDPGVRRLQQTLGKVLAQSVMQLQTGAPQVTVDGASISNVLSIREPLAGPGAEIEEVRRRLFRLDLSGEQRTNINMMLSEIEAYQEGSEEYNKRLEFLRLVGSLPWGGDATPETAQPREAVRAALDETHFGMDKSKQVILDQTSALRWWAHQRPADSVVPPPLLPSLLFVGPPGTGKTTLLASVAEAMGRHLQVISCGGMSDIQALTGFERTYIGSRPGAVIDALRRAGTVNLVLAFDEIDKMEVNWRGDPFAVLMELTDPARNHDFTDRYLQMGFDLSRVMIVATANQPDRIPEALKSRMQIVEARGYSPAEKFTMARTMLLPRIYDDLLLPPDRVAMDDSAVRRIVDEYTFESGVRQLMRQLRSVLQRNLDDLLLTDAARTVDASAIPALLGKPWVRNEVAPLTGPPGYGVVLFFIPGSGQGGVGGLQVSLLPPYSSAITATGTLGDDIKETSRVALTHVRIYAERYGIDPAAVEGKTLHIHQDGIGITKSGPSGGVATVLALVSLLTGTPWPEGMAVTGEITVDGRVLPVGGIGEKVVAAHRSGIRRILVPEANAEDLDDIPADVRAVVDVATVGHLNEAVGLAFPELRPSATPQPVG